MVLARARIRYCLPHRSPAVLAREKVGYAVVEEAEASMVLGGEETKVGVAINIDIGIANLDT